MDLDEEIFQRLANTEDHFTERKTSLQRDQCTEAMVAFANSAIPNKPGILFIGITDDGEVVGGDNLDSWQRKLTEWANGCFPEIPIIPRVLSKDDKQFLAVVVPHSTARPHFSRPAFKRLGAQTLAATQKEIDEWIAYRNSKVRLILDRKGQVVTLRTVAAPNDPRAMFGTQPGDYRIEDCNEHFVTLYKEGSGSVVTELLSRIELKMDDEKHRLMLLFWVY